MPSGGAPWNSLVIGNQFALAGLSRSYNVVGFFEKYGFQTRVAYSHRGAFLAGVGQTDQTNEPVYTAAYGQLDMSASYDITKHFSVFFDGINLTSASQQQYGRYTEQFYLRLARGLPATRSASAWCCRRQSAPRAARSGGRSSRARCLRAICASGS